MCRFFNCNSSIYKKYFKKNLEKVISELEISIPLRLINFKQINTSREYTKL